MDTGTPILKTAAVVLNGASGALLGRADASAALDDLLRAAGFAPRFIPREAGTLPWRMKLACETGAPLLIVAGGDGTIACAAQEAHAAGVTLGILPFGTMNVLAVDLGIPVGDVAAAVALLRDGTVREIDAASVGGRIYLCNSLLGLPARLARYREAGRGKGSVVRLWLRFARAALRAFARYGSPRIVLSVDGVERRTHAAALSVTPNLLNDSSGRLLGRARMDAGVLGVYAIRHLTLRSIPRLLIRALIGQLRTDPDLKSSSAQAVTVTRFGQRSGKAVRVMNDGEVFLMRPPLNYRILPRAIRIIAPPAK
jgi:diacylglycerol kinase family enzyme